MVELLEAALCYASVEHGRNGGSKDMDITKELMKFWPWHRCWWKPSDDPIRNLVKAGALLAAEIDRLQAIRDEPPPTRMVVEDG